MKRLLILVFTLLAVVCSCKKAEDPKDLLTGTWKVKTKIELTSSAGSATSVEEYDYVFTFDRDGYGEIVKDSQVYPFNYQFNDSRDKISYDFEDKSHKDGIWTVDELTEDRFVFHETTSTTFFGYTYTSVTTLKGRKRN